MTHKDIYEKFMIEYDKSDITSSYPSLTTYEIATVLNKAYLALIAQKLTGNNQRKVAFEYDTKAIEDLRPLIDTTSCTINNKGTKLATNDTVYSTPGSFLYIIGLRFYNTEWYNVSIVNHAIAQSYMSSAHNKPWIEEPVAFLENSYIHLLTDPYITILTDSKLYVTYIKVPTKFSDTTVNTDKTAFELSDTMAEELINLAIAMSLEMVESTRLSTKSSLLPLES